MIHSVNLARDRVAHPMQGDDLEALRHELHIREFVMVRINAPGRLRGEARVWFDYMQAHALLQIQRYAWKMPEREFFQACKRLRDKRDAAAKRCNGQAWFSTEKN